MLGILDRIRCTWGLMGASWRVLLANKSLLVFPLFSGLASIVVIASFWYPLARVFPNGMGAENAPAASEAARYAVVFAFYLCNYFVIIFFNSALVACAMVGMHGGKLTVGDGLRMAGSRLPAIFGWALVSATVGLVLRIIEDRSETVGKIMSSLLGTAWTMVTFLAVPVLVVEKRGPFEAFKRSASLLKRTWGEQIAGHFAFGIVFFLLALPAFVIVFSVLGLSGGAGGPLVIALFVALAIYILTLAMVQSALHSIFRAALYLYAINGEAPSGFGRSDLLRGAVGSR